MRREHADVLIVGSGAGGGTVAQRLIPLVRAGKRVLLLEQGGRLKDVDFTGDELAMPPALYEDAGGFLTADGTMTLAFGRVYGGSTAVYTGTSLQPPRRVIESWEVPGLDHDDLIGRTERYIEENNVHLLGEEEINDNNRLFVEGCRALGWKAEQFPVNVRGCKGSSLCNLGCPNQAKQGTDRVQLPAAEGAGVEVVTRAEVLRIQHAPVDEDACAVAHVRIHPLRVDEKGLPSEWEPGEARVTADTVVVAGGSVGSSALLLRSGFGRTLPRLGHGFTCHPAFILVGEHPEPITNDVGHPKSYFLDRAEEEGWVLETCMYFPFVTAKNLTGFGPAHSRLMHAFDRLQMILVLAADKNVRSNRIEVDENGHPVVHYTFTDPVRESLAAATRAAARIFFAAGAVRVHAPLASPPLLERAMERAMERPMEGKEAPSGGDVPEGSRKGENGSEGLSVRSGPPPGRFRRPAAPSAGLTERLDRLIEHGIRAENFLPGRTSVSAAHLMGGCRMGSGPADSVTDHRGRVHGVPWLRVADSSLFPDSVEINPYLTIMALADRVAEGILEETESGRVTSG